MTDAETTTNEQQKPRILGFQIDAELDAQITYAAQAVKLSRSATARLAVERGLPVILDQLRSAND
jgi:hypothetical protein